jgi:aspartate-semialdehyde dehydrogenase
MSGQMDDQAQGAGYAVAVVGAASLVGETLVQVLEERDFPVRELHLLGSLRALGRQLSFRGQPQALEPLDGFDFGRVQLAFFCAGARISLEHAPRAAAAGCLVIDSTAAFRGDPDVPLVVPEVNGSVLKAGLPRRIVASPGSVAVQLALPLAPLHRAAEVVAVHVATYQSVSGAGQDAVKELARQSAALLSGEGLQSRKAPARPLAFICVPEIGPTGPDGFTVEEVKLRDETRKLLEAPGLPVTATCVRVPVFYGHAAAVSLALRRPLTVVDARAVLQEAPGVTLFADGTYPTAAAEAAGHDTVYVGRIREDSSPGPGLNLWTAIDNVRKGAATNSIQIAESWVALPH